MLFLKPYTTTLDMTKTASANAPAEKKSAGWYVLLLAWLVYGSAFYALSKSLVKPAADITNYDILNIFNTYSSYTGIGLGLISFLVAGVIYLIVRLILRGPSLAAASLITALGFAPWLIFGWDLVYREPRYAEVARAIITYLGKPMLYSAVIVCSVTIVIFVCSLIFKKRTV